VTHIGGSGVWIRAAAKVTAQADAAGLTGTQRAGADACVRYLTSKHDYLRYDQALAAKQDLDMPNARRDACRTIVSMRLAFGVSLDEAEEALHDVESRWRAALEGRDLFGAYVNAVDATYPVLQRIFTSQDLAEGMRSAAYWNLLQMADTQANRGGIFAGTVQALRVMRVETLEPSRAALQALASEITTQIEALERAETELQALRDLASRPGLPIVYDTNMLNHWRQPGDIRWREFLKGRGEQTTIARLVVPLRVIDELDRQKYGQGDLAKKAATAIRYLERVLKDNEPGQPVILRQEDAATLEVWVDSDDRSDDADLSILRCAADLDNLHRATGARVLTDDFGMRLRAGQMGLKIMRLDEEYRKKCIAMSEADG
jgi:PIN domain